MGIPKAQTVIKDGSIAWNINGSDHFTQPVFKKGIPVDSAEDNEAHEIQKYERNEAVRALLTDGVLLGNVWNDGTIKDSFKVSWDGSILTIKSGRAIVGTRRIDLGLGVNADQDLDSNTVGSYIEGYTLPAIAHEHVMFIQIYERAVDGTIYFSPAGTAANRSKYFYNIQDVRYYDSATIGASFNPPNTPDTASQFFLEIGRIGHTGTVTDKRTLSYVKVPSQNAAGLIVHKTGIIGVDCTHTSLTAAIADLTSTFGQKVDAGTKLTIWVKPGTYNLSTEGAAFPIALPTGLIIMGTDPKRLIPDQRLIGSFTPPDNMALITGDPFNSNLFSGTNITLWSLRFFVSTSGSKGGVLPGAHTFVNCIVNCTGAQSGYSFSSSYFYECIISEMLGSSSQYIFDRCVINILTNLGQIINGGGGLNATPTLYKDCTIFIDVLASGDPTTNAGILQTDGYTIFQNCFIRMGHTNSVPRISSIGGEMIFNKCYFFMVEGSSSVTVTGIYIQNITTFIGCYLTFNVGGAFSFAKVTAGGTLSVFGGTYLRTASSIAPTTSNIFAIESSTSEVSAKFFNVSMDSVAGYCISILASGSSTYTVEIENCSLKGNTNNMTGIVYIGVSDTPVLNFYMMNCTLRNLGTTNCFYMQSLGGTPTGTSYILNSVLFATGTTSIQKDYTISMTGTTYTGDITGGATGVTTQSIGEGTRCNNTKIGGTAIVPAAFSFRVLRALTTQTWIVPDNVTFGRFRIWSSAGAGAGGGSSGDGSFDGNDGGNGADGTDSWVLNSSNNARGGKGGKGGKKGLTGGPVGAGGLSAIGFAPLISSTYTKSGVQTPSNDGDAGSTVNGGKGADSDRPSFPMNVFTRVGGSGGATLSPGNPGTDGPDNSASGGGGGGGGGGSSGGGGGGGGGAGTNGEYMEIEMALTPGASITLNVAASSAAGTAGPQAGGGSRAGGIGGKGGSGLILAEYNS